MSFAKILMFSLWLLSTTKADEIHDFNLPASKQYLVICQSQAIALHSGIIEKQNLFEIQHHFFVQYDIQMPNEAIFVVICDLNNGQIVQAQNPANFQK